jgi:tetratricopeptide (TPR) repeat protein
MSDRDLLARATEALRMADGRPSNEPDPTMHRVLVTLRRSRSRRRHVVTVVLSLAAVLAGSTAWSMASGRLPAAWKSAAAYFSRAPSPAASEVRSPKASVPAAPIAAVPEPRIEAAEVPTEAPIAAASIDRSRASSKPAREKPSSDPFEPLYQRAHRSHFVDGDYTKALELWNDYLQSDPRGAFALEARYNRAIALLKVGQSTEAAAALRPFADGSYGAYRQREAREIIDALEH